jgi:serine/threonine protein kinase
VKIFDFGLAKELDDSMKARGCDDFYELSGNTGSLRYMAPEVALSENYNLTADVYSFGLLLWQIASLNLPYDGMSRADHSFCVVKGNERPTLDSNWPPTLCALMKRAWDPDPCLRPSMDSVHKLLKREIVSLRGGDDTEFKQSRRRSSLFFRRGSASNNEDSRGSLGNLLLSRVSSLQGTRTQTPSRRNSTEVPRRQSPNRSGNAKQPRGKSPKRSFSHQPVAA